MRTVPVAGGFVSAPALTRPAPCTVKEWSVSFSPLKGETPSWAEAVETSAAPNASPAKDPRIVLFIFQTLFVFETRLDAKFCLSPRSKNGASAKSSPSMSRWRSWTRSSRQPVENSRSSARNVFPNDFGRAVRPRNDLKGGAIRRHRTTGCSLTRESDPFRPAAKATVLPSRRRSRVFAR